jgi:hypothetical protein
LGDAAFARDKVRALKCFPTGQLAPVTVPELFVGYCGFILGAVLPPDIVESNSFRLVRSILDPPGGGAAASALSMQLL